MKETQIDISEELEKHVINIMDTFTCGDGGAKFVKFRIAIENFEKQALAGDESSKILLKMVTDFSKLLNAI